MKTDISREYNELIKRISLADKVKLGLEILAAYLRVAWTFRDRDLARVVTGLRSVSLKGADGLTDSRAQYYAALRLGRSVDRTLRLLPTDSRCLSQSLVLTRLLARRGIPSTLVIGVAPGTRFRAHAWIENAEGVPLLPPLAGEFERLTAI